MKYIIIHYEKDIVYLKDYDSMLRKSLKGVTGFQFIELSTDILINPFKISKVSKKELSTSGEVDAKKRYTYIEKEVVREDKPPEVVRDEKWHQAKADLQAKLQAAKTEKSCNK